MKRFTIVVAVFCVMILFNDFEPFAKVVWGASDTETFTHIDGVKVSENELKELGKIKPQAFFRQHATVRVWAWQFSDGKHFFVTNDFDEYIDFLCEHKVNAVWFYNAKFDFAQIDYQLLTHNPVYTPTTDDTKKSTPWTYSSLHSDKGGRYSLKIWTPYKAHGKGSRKANRTTHTHATTFFDFCNIFGGGLKNLFEEFDVEDEDGNAIRKSTMDYQGVDEYALTQADFDYLRNDTIGLFHLIRKASATLEELTGYTLTKSKPDVMTAGGLAKKMLLRFLYPDLPERSRKKFFQHEHPLTVEQDKFLRDNRLYNGGECLINPAFTGRLITGDEMRKRFGTCMRRYDVNSEYPFVMSEMKDIYGKCEVMKFSAWKKAPKEYRENHIAIYVFDGLQMSLREGFIPCFRNGYNTDYEAEVDIDERYLLFEEEVNELSEWYKIDNTVEKVIVYKTRQITGYRNFVETFYELKNTSKKNGDKAKTAFAKLLLNSSYGKLAERVIRDKTVREINPETGAIHLVNRGEQEIDETSMLSVVQGAYVTARARIWILSHIREICNGKVAERLVYCDTDSVHAFAVYDKADAYSLGGFKDESPEDGFNAVKYIAPKCYFDAVIDEETGKTKNVEIHSKGLNIKVIESEFTDGVDRSGKKPKPIWKPIAAIDKRFNYGEKFQPLSGMNIRGGKALIPIEKYLAKPVAGFVDTNNGLCEL